MDNPIVKTIVILCIFILLFNSIFTYNKEIKQPRCLYMADVGPCDEEHLVYGYDYVSNRCVDFIYGGCGGNPNRFASKKECMKACHVDYDVEEEEELDHHDDIYWRKEL